METHRNSMHQYTKETNTNTLFANQSLTLSHSLMIVLLLAALVLFLSIFSYSPASV